VARQSERSPGGPITAGALALSIVGLLALVTLAASGSHGVRDARPAARPVPDSVQDSWITLLTIAYAVGIGAMLFTIVRRRSRWKDPGSHWLRNYCAVFVFMLAITAAGYLALTHGDLRERTQALLRLRAQQGQAQGSKSVTGKPLPPRRAHFQWPLVLGLGGLVLLCGAWVVFGRNRRAVSRPTDAETLEEELARAMGSTIEDLRGERDARRAVIAAYANMERILAAHGLERRHAEVPYEYLTRVLQVLQVRESAVQSLTELFEYAKFSDHEIDPVMKERAIGSLVAVQEDLQVTAGAVQ
jgi:uncharacterized protein DUF4129